jgi:hypothetical protein
MLDLVDPQISAADIAEVLVTMLAERDAAIANLLARIEALEAKNHDGDLDGRVNLKSAAFQLRCSAENLRRKCAAGRIDALKDKGQWRIRL